MRAQGAEGADGNARLTGAVGLVLLVALFLEGLTLLEVSDLITLHVFLGLLLIPPTTLKIASTAYRFFRYYTHSPVYVSHGPPHPVLRMTAPLVIIFTGAVLASGVALLVVGPEHPGLILTAHKASFILWFAAMALHVLGHLKEAVLLSRWDWLPRADHARPRGKGLRRGLSRHRWSPGSPWAQRCCPSPRPGTTATTRASGTITPWSSCGTRARTGQPPAGMRDRRNLPPQTAASPLLLEAFA